MLDFKYKLGIPVIDYQHKQLLTILNKLEQKILNKKQLRNIILQLKDCAVYHFKTEEEYFKNNNYKNMKEHIQLHNIYIQTIDYYCSGNNYDQNKIYTFLSTWFKKHVLIEDKKIIIKETLKK